MKIGPNRVLSRYGGQELKQPGLMYDYHSEEPRTAEWNCACIHGW
jgi:hypothetical protein